MSWHERVTQEMRDRVDEFKRNTIKDVPPSILDDDDLLFYRFMKARDFNLQNAETMLRKHIAWRKEFKVDTILTDHKTPEVIEKYFPASFVGFSKDGSVVRYVDFGGADVKGYLNSAKKTDIIKYNIKLMEQDIERLEEHSKKLGRSVTQIIYINNHENMTFSKATNKRALELMLLGARIYQDNYPERINKVFNINVSIYFTMLFSVVKSVIAAPVIAKMQFFGTGGWKEALLNEVDADVLPAFLGGNRTDPDGNLLCNTFVKHGGMVPECYYFRKSARTLFLSPGVKKLTVTRFSKSDIKFDVEDPDTLLEWEFETKSRDIGFGVYFKEKNSKESKPVELVPKQRIDTCIAPELGVYRCEKAGKYIMVFDNSYSWIYPKDVFYRVRIIRPKDEDNQHWN